MLTARVRLEVVVGAGGSSSSHDYFSDDEQEVFIFPPLYTHKM